VRGEALLSLVRILVEIEAWKTVSTPAPGVAPDTCFAKLIITAGGETVTLSEPFNDLEELHRIARVRKALEGLFPK
jgi:hypothetical protein